MEVVLSKLETLTDKYITAQALEHQEHFAEIRKAHAADVTTFLAGVGERVGIQIPPTARRVVGPDGSVRLTWDDEAPAPAPMPVDPHAPALGP